MRKAVSACVLAEDQYLGELKPVLHQAGHWWCQHCGEMGFVTALAPVMQPGESIRAIAPSSSSLIFTCSALGFFERKPMEHFPSAVGTATGAWGWRAVRRLNLYRRVCNGQSCINGKIIEENLLCPPQQVPQVIGNVGMELKMWPLHSHL